MSIRSEQKEVFRIYMNERRDWLKACSQRRYGATLKPDHPGDMLNLWNGWRIKVNDLHQDIYGRPYCKFWREDGTVDYAAQVAAKAAE